MAERRLESVGNPAGRRVSRAGPSMAHRGGPPNHCQIPAIVFDGAISDQNQDQDLQHGGLKADLSG